MIEFEKRLRNESVNDYTDVSSLNLKEQFYQSHK